MAENFKASSHDLVVTAGCYEEGGSRARQGPRTVMSTMPWRRSFLLCKDIFKSLWRLRGPSGLDGGGLASCFDEIESPGVLRFCDSSGLSAGPNKSLRLISARIFSFSHRIKRVNNERKRKMVRYINGSIFISSSSFWWFRRFLFRTGNRATHGRISLHVFHSIIIHDAQISLSKGFSHCSGHFGFRFDDTGAHFLF
jgi:hypothetical protein